VKAAEGIMAVNRDALFLLGQRFAPRHGRGWLRAAHPHRLPASDLRGRRLLPPL